MDADGDESFDDDWWDSLAIDPVTDTQLQALEIQAQASGNVNTPASTAPSEPASLQAQLQELRALQAKQQELIDTLTRQTQQQKGEIAVVRANWKRAQEQNSGLQQKQTQLESEYRERFERIQQENRRQIEKLETAAAFRDTNRTAWPSSLRRRAPVMITDTGATKRTPGFTTLTTPTHNRIVHHVHSPGASPTPISPLSLTRRKRSLPDEPTKFPRFVNSFLQPGLSSSLATPAASRAAKSPPHTPPDAERSSSPVTPSPDLGPVRTCEQMDAPDASMLVLTTLFCYRTRWATQVMCQPFLALPPPASVPGTQYFPLGPGLHTWCAALDPDAEKESKPEDAPSIPMLLHLLSMQLPHAVPERLRRRFSHAAEVLWDSVTKSSSYNVFLAECGHVVDDALREHSAYTPASIDAVVERVWELQTGALFGTVAAALRVLTGVFLRLNLPGFVPFLLKKVQYLDWAEPDTPQVPEHSMVPSNQDDKELLPSSQESQEPSKPDTSAPATPTSLVKMWIECVRKCHAVPLSVSSPDAQPEADAQGEPVWDMGPEARMSLLGAIVRCARVLAWTVGQTGLVELQPFFQQPGVLLTLLDVQTSSHDVLYQSVDLLSSLIPDVMTLHMALASPYDHALQPRVPARLLQVRFSVVDILAKHLVDRRGDTSAAYVQKLHTATLLFMSSAARYGDTAVILSESVPLLPALIQCLSWDTEEVWGGAMAGDRTEQYVDD
ncbi:hypothetical protein CBS14141_001151 [Malassezia furfur]|nr:hypothetical protein CBS14141_001151 [Malassezia furfur]